LPPPRGSTPSSLVVGVVGGESSSDPSSASTPLDYELHISQEEATEPAPPDTEPTPDTPPEVPLPYTPPISPSYDPPDEQDSTPPVPIRDDVGADQDWLRMEALSLRSAGPLGGILTDS